jgi:hypothetical protein
MRTRRIALLSLLATLAILAAACGEGASSEGDGVVLRYAYRPGDTLSYEVEVAANMTMESSGDAALVAAIDGTMALEITERLKLAFAEGPDPASIQITMTQELIEGSARVVTQGQEQFLPFDQLAANVESEVVVVVDPRGKLLSVSIGGVPLPARLLTELSAMSGSTSLQPQQLGPEFPEEGLSVGEEWETGTATEVLGLGMTQTSRHRVVGEEETLGHSTYRIDSEITTGTMAADLASLIAALRESPGLIREADAAEIDAALGRFEGLGIGLDFVMEESTALMTTWFDPAAGIVVLTTLESPVTMHMTLTGIPGAGEVVVFIEMSTSQQMSLAD